MGIVTSKDYSVIWVEEGREYLGVCKKFPSLSWLAPTQGAALKGIKKVVQESIEDMRKERAEKAGKVKAFTDYCNTLKEINRGI